MAIERILGIVQSLAFIVIIIVLGRTKGVALQCPFPIRYPICYPASRDE